MHRTARGTVKMGDNPTAPEQWLVPCKQCIACRLKRQRDWAIRAMHEAQMHERNSFITLTFNNEHLPVDLSLDVRHWQLFAKRLRKVMGPFRFLMCGEYTEEREPYRPHYHAALFGVDFSADRYPWRLSKKGHQLYRSPSLEKAWKFGFAEIGTLTYDSAAYVAGYVTKKIIGGTCDDEYAKRYLRTTSDGLPWMVKPEFALMSRRPGLGYDWFRKYREDCFPHDYVVTEKGTFSVPDYYDSLLLATDPDMYIEVKEKREQKAEEYVDDPSSRQASEKTINSRLAMFGNRPDVF